MGFEGRKGEKMLIWKREVKISEKVRQYVLKHDRENRYLWRKEEKKAIRDKEERYGSSYAVVQMTL